MLYRWFLATILALILPFGQALAADIKVAVASNFVVTMAALADAFESSTGHRVTITPGSTGKHYAQIKNGAPFHAFFAADSKRPELLDKEGLIVSGSRFTYAVGRIVLWSSESGFVDPQGAVLKTESFRYLAIANPKLAPYGRAAKEVLQALGLWSALKTKMVRGENIGQTFQFVSSGNAQLGFVAESQLKQLALAKRGSHWRVPAKLYKPIQQQAVLLKNNEVASAFMAFVSKPESRQLIKDFGYSML